jgi:two-component system response regulator AlgR
MTSALRILIVDDEAPARERLRELLQDGYAEVPSEVAAEAASGPQALALLPECGANLALVDIHMPVMNGIELARHFQLLEHPPGVVFVTAHERYAVEAFDLNAIDYLLKPVRLPRLLAALRKAAAGQRPGPEQLARADPGPRRYFSVAERGKVSLVPVEEVMFLKAELKYVTLHTREREFLVEEPLAQLEQELGALFLRVHRNCLVARRLIRGVEQLKAALGDDNGEPRWGVLLEGHAEPIRVSRRQWSAVKTLLKSRN